MVKCMDLKRYSLMNFDNYIQLYNPYPYHNTEHFCHPQKLPCAFSLSTPLFPPHLEATTVAWSRTSCKWNHSVWILVPVFEFRCVVMCISSSSVSLRGSHCMDIPQFVYPLSCSATFGLFPYFGYYDWTFIFKSSVDICFHFSWVNA